MLEVDDCLERDIVIAQINTLTNANKYTESNRILYIFLGKNYCA